MVVVPIKLHKDTRSVDPRVMFKQLFSVSCKFTVTFWVGSACNCASIENLKWKMTGGGLQCSFKDDAYKNYIQQDLKDVTKNFMKGVSMKVCSSQLDS